MKLQIPRYLHTFQITSIRKEIRGVIAFAVALMGVINGLTVLLPTRPGRLDILLAFFNYVAPFAPSIWPFVQVGRTVALILGFFLCLLALGLARGKRRAWQFAIVLLPLSALAHIAKGLDFEEAVLVMLVWCALLIYQSFFCVESDPWRMRQGVVLLLVGFGLLLLYSLVGFYLLQTQILITGSSSGALYSLLRRFVNLPARELLPLTGHATWFLQSIPLLSATALVTGMIALLRPVSARWWITYQRDRLKQECETAQALVRSYGNQTLSFFALAPENLQYLAPAKEGVVNYRLTGDVAVVLGDPVCKPYARERVIQNFLDLCALHDWKIAVFQAHPDYLPFYRRFGLHAFKIGEEAFIDPQTFTLTGPAMANVRTSCRRAERDGVRLQWYEGIPPQEILDQLQHLSQAWLERKGGNNVIEMGFSMGRLAGLPEDAARADALADMHVAAEGKHPEKTHRLVTGVAFYPTGRACAFVTFTPIYGIYDSSSMRRHAWGWAIDLMRRAQDAPPGVMELLIARAIERFRCAGAEVVSLGTVAMADARQEMSPGQRKIAGFVSEHFHLLETHRSLLHFKQKFQPSWESRYIVASSTLALPKIALALLRVHQS